MRPARARRGLGPPGFAMPVSLSFSLPRRWGEGSLKFLSIHMDVDWGGGQSVFSSTFLFQKKVRAMHAELIRVRELDLLSISLKPCKTFFVLKELNTNASL